MPKLTSVTINYNSGVKINIGNYESYSIGDSESRTYDVSDLDETQVEEFIVAVREDIMNRIDDYVEAGYATVKGRSK